MRIAVVILVAMVAAGATTAPVEWGDAKEGLAVSVRVEGQAVAGKKMIFVVSVRNEGALPVKVGDAFGWMLLAQSREKAIYSGKVAMGDVKGWPGELEAGKSVQVEVDLSEREVYAYQKGVKVAGGYPAAEDAKAVGTFAKSVSEGAFKGRWMLVLPVQKPALTLTSNALTVRMLRSEVKGEHPELIEQFRKDPYAAQAAHGRAVKMGAEAVEDLSGLAGDHGAPGFARMWAATALCDIGGEKAVAALIKLVEDPNGDVANVVAYHGAKLKHAGLGKAIAERAEKGVDQSFTAWAARGVSQFGGEFPEKLVAVVMAGHDPRARAEIALVLARRPVGKNLDDLISLLGDENDLVRAGAARALGDGKLKTQRVMGALVAGLDRPGEVYRQSACEMLSVMTGQTWKYDAEADAAAKSAVIQSWKNWWVKNKEKYP